MVRPGDVVTLRRSATPWTVGRVLGEGSEGTVYELVPADGAPRRLALKWYADKALSDQRRQAITAVAQRSSPGPMFLWPMEVITAADGRFGYVMPLRPTGFVGLGELLKGKVEVSPSMAVRLSLGLAPLSLRADTALEQRSLPIRRLTRHCCRGQCSQIVRLCPPEFG